MLGIDFVICYIYSSYISYRLFGITLFPKVFFSSSLFRVVVTKSKNNTVISNVEVPIIFESFVNGVDRTVFNIGSNSILEINNRINIGNGCSISLAEKSKLTLCGELDGQVSGITSNTIIICKKKIHIGRGCIISWGCYITDTSNHYINGYRHDESVFIGDKVWISEGCTVAPGASIGDGSIVGAKSYVKGTFTPKTLIAGCPAKIKKWNIDWSR
ncbi:acyltransferase [Vibrio campbellii]|uniref:acyltransferase n=1 Tax=Vibrio campbellii TaxID=680 RepID=UPI00168CDFF1|nr:hypothetical protein [Vibrio campbellii]